MRSLLTLSLWLFAAPLAVHAQSHACASVAEPAARLACYDSAFPPAAEVIQAASEQAQADFGLDKAPEPLRNPGQVAAQADPDRIESKVAKVNHGGLRSFQLENGQVWTQTDSRGGGHVNAGDLVQVRKAVLSGYQLIMPNGVAVRVRRTR